VITSDQALVIQSGSLHKGVLLNLPCSQFFHLKILTLEKFASSKKRDSSRLKLWKSCLN